HGGDWTAPVFLAIITTATSVSISVQTLREMNKLRSRQGIMILGAAIIDDVVGIILLTLLVGVVKPGAGNSFGAVLLGIALLAGLVVLVGFLVVRLIAWLESKYDIESKLIVFAFVLCLGLAYLSEHFGVAGITGAYFAGVIMSMTSFRHRISHEMSRVSGVIFTPIFFVSIGMGIDISAATTALGVGSILFVLGSLGKIIGCGFGAKLSGFSTKHSLQIGVGMIPRAEVALIIANLGLQMGVLNSQHMAATVLMVLSPHWSRRSCSSVCFRVNPKASESDYESCPPYRRDRRIRLIG
ncbi:MAG: cation:proton antiporter, partial [Bacillota bacterium]|nr:cation:proton antiporter [Bacillota bacterium]